ncbi:MAG: adenylyltransferase/cytidyltransferase family protein, partial [Terriglobales bacterium]
MNIGLFSGTFDPIHRGHLALAQASQERFSLGRVYFVPTGNPPHKQKQPLAAFVDRYAMVVLATMAEKTFFPSLLEAPGLPQVSGKKNAALEVNYSIDTVQRLKRTLKRADRLYFLIGIDAFDEIAKWHQAEALFR